jgi:hypothetical protein
MRYVNPLVEGSSPSPVNKTTRDSFRQEQPKALLSRSFPLGRRLNLQTDHRDSLAQPETRKRPHGTTNGATGSAFGRLDHASGLQFFVDARDKLPDEIQSSMMAIFKAAGR